MLDPFFAPPTVITTLTKPIGDALALPTLPLHAHEVLIAFSFYHFINTRISPPISSYLFPQIYPHLPHRTKINWDVHVVSLVQSCLINILALWVMWQDEERTEMNWRGRVWGYTGASGMIQGFAAGYFLWDLVVTAQNVGIFGWGMLAHAISAVIVFSFGFRPFVNFYGPTFILYELSSPFLNFHWFFDKLNMTGSRAQLYNGLILLATFFSCRLVWGTYQSVRVYQDVWAALQMPGAAAMNASVSNNSTIPAGAAGATAAATAAATTTTITSTMKQSLDPNLEIMRFAGEQVVPVWLAMIYLGSNIVLNTLNFYWFGKMIETVKKRFQPPKEAEEKKGKKAEQNTAVDGHAEITSLQHKAGGIGDVKGASSSREQESARRR
ncbi:MAG: hypothetical protein M1827_005291 [Pycnora praestabilis]|nr:MAG: hypothetical protein M1827_005291 [Pycnora praestabilis]